MRLLKRLLNPWPRSFSLTRLSIGRTRDFFRSSRALNDSEVFFLAATSLRFLFPALFAEFKSFLAARSRAAWAKDKGAGRG
jgi:hypothetical protein